MNIIDSSGWLEYFADTKNAGNFSKPIEDIKRLIVPTIIIFEVYKKIIQEKNENLALMVVAHMKQGQVVDFDFDLSLLAAVFAKQYNLSMVDSIIYATARNKKAILWTQDSDFRKLKNVKYFPKK